MKPGKHLLGSRHEGVLMGQELRISCGRLPSGAGDGEFRKQPRETFHGKYLPGGPSLLKHPPELVIYLLIAGNDIRRRRKAIASQSLIEGLFLSRIKIQYGIVQIKQYESYHSLYLRIFSLCFGSSVYFRISVQHYISPVHISPVCSRRSHWPPQGFWPCRPRYPRRSFLLRDWQGRLWLSHAS